MVSTIDITATPPGATLTAPGAVRVWISRLGPFLGLALVILTFALLTDAPGRYLSPFNLRIVLSQTVIVALGAIGMTMIIISGGIDLSVGAVIALTGVVTALGLAVASLPLFGIAIAVIWALVGWHVRRWERSAVDDPG